MIGTRPPEAKQAPRPSARSQRAAARASGRSNYFVESYQELRKVVWPAWPELWRMTGVVVVTVILVGVFIALVDSAASHLLAVFYNPPK